jgi:hypothetical protein
MAEHQVPNVSAEQVKEAVNVTKRRFWRLHNCSMCRYPCGYIFDEKGEVSYDSGCYCVRSMPPHRPSDFQDVANQINMQNDEWRKKMWDELSTTEPEPAQ